MEVRTSASSFSKPSRLTMCMGYQPMGVGLDSKVNGHHVAERQVMDAMPLLCLIIHKEPRLYKVSSRK